MESSERAVWKDEIIGLPFIKTVEASSSKLLNYSLHENKKDSQTATHPSFSESVRREGGDASSEGKEDSHFRISAYATALHWRCARC